MAFLSGFSEQCPRGASPSARASAAESRSVVRTGHVFLSLSPARGHLGRCRLLAAAGGLLLTRMRTRLFPTPLGLRPGITASRGRAARRARGPRRAVLHSGPPPAAAQEGPRALPGGPTSADARRAVPGCVSFSPEDRGRPLSSASPPSPSCPPPRDPSPPPGEAQAPQSPSALPGRVRAAPVPRGPWSRRPSAPQHRRGAGPHFAMRVGTPGPSVFSGRPLIASLPCVSPRKGDICSTAVLLLPVLNHDGFIRFFFPHIPQN